MKRALFAGLLGTALVGPQLAHADDAAIVHAASSIDDDATPFIYAMQNGLFTRNGISADLQRSTSGSASVAGIIGGTFQIAKSSVTSLSTAHVRGLPLVWIAPGGEFDANLPQVVGLIVKADGPIKTGADFNGKTIGVTALNDFFTLATRAWVDKHGGDWTSLKFTEIPMSQAQTAIVSGRIDAAAVVQPFFDAAKNDPTILMIGDPSAALGSRFMQSCWFTSTDYAAKNPKTIAAFIAVMREANGYVNTHHPETADLLAKFMHVDAAPLKDRFPMGTRFDVNQIQLLIDEQAKYKMIPGRFDVHDVLYPGAIR